MATKADNPLYDTPLDRFDWMALRDLAKSQNDFEPIEARAKTGDVMAERLVCIGLAEVGPCSAFYAEKGFRSGYRVTPLGCYVMELGEFPDPWRKRLRLVGQTASPLSASLLSRLPFR